MKMENLFVTWQQRSAPASMPISVSGPNPRPPGAPCDTSLISASAHCPISPGRGAGDPEAVVPPGALLRNSPAL